jgi:cytochrome c-type protein NapB
MKMTKISVFVLLLIAVFVAQADEAVIATLRGDTNVPENAPAPAFPKIDNSDVKRKRNYPMQAPTIPHKTDNYQVDQYSNKCMSCHSRRRTEESQAPMVSVTHFMDRDGNFLAEVSPRRYFCNQCHVPLYDIKIEVENTFEDVDAIIDGARKSK